MKIETRQFGLMEIDDGCIYTMADGMPGFKDMKKYVIIERKEIWPFICYQCLDDSLLSFYIMNPALFMPEYQPDLSQGIREVGWEGDDPEDINLYVIVNTSAGVPEKITANLIGPLLVNTRRFEAEQLVLHNSTYSHQHLIFSKPQAAKKTTGGQEAVKV